MNKNLLIYIGLLLSISACSVDIGNSRKSTFSAPILTNNQWESIGYPFKDSDTAYCLVDGGRNSIRLIMELAKGETQATPFIEGTRPMRSGTIFTINSSDNNFKTYEKALPANRSSAILNDLLNGQKVYLRWSEVNGGSGRQNFTNIITPNNFIPPYEKCQEFINELAG